VHRLQGYRAEWNEHSTILTCLPEASSSAAYQRTAVIVSSIAGALVLGLLLLVWRQYLTTRPRWLRERVMQSKRTKGPPRCTKPGDKVTVSVVVTDVKGEQASMVRHTYLLKTPSGCYLPVAERLPSCVVLFVRILLEHSCNHLC
jgi:hypothetical protein